jgi:hypothetical protein
MEALSCDPGPAEPAPNSELTSVLAGQSRISGRGRVEPVPSSVSEISGDRGDLRSVGECAR